MERGEQLGQVGVRVNIQQFVKDFNLRTFFAWDQDLILVKPVQIVVMNCEPA